MNKHMLVAQLPVVLGALILGGAACSTADTSLKARMITFGVSRPVGEQRRIPDASSPTGYVTKGDTEFTARTTRVPAVRGAAFGFEFRLDGVPGDRPIPLTRIIRHPPMHKPDGTVIQEQTFTQNIMSERGYVEGKFWYILRENYEIVPGDWTISMLCGDQLLLEQRFTVAPPD